MRLSLRTVWARLATTLLGPVTLAAASFSAISWRSQLTLLALGALFTTAGFIANERLLKQEVIKSVLDTAVSFMRSAGLARVRANLMIVKKQKDILPRYFSSNFLDFERQNQWRRGDKSCAATALERGAPTLGGIEGELLPQGTRSDVTIMKMVRLNDETTRTVLSVPVFRKERQDEVIGILNFVDDLGMDKSKVATPEVVQAVSKLGPIIIR